LAFNNSDNPGWFPIQHTLHFGAYFPKFNFSQKDFSSFLTGISRVLENSTIPGGEPSRNSNGVKLGLAKYTPSGGPPYRGGLSLGRKTKGLLWRPLFFPELVVV